jgi:hypothetical protein
VGTISFLNSSGSAIVAATAFTVTSGQIFPPPCPSPRRPRPAGLRFADW